MPAQSVTWIPIAILGAVFQTTALGFDFHSVRGRQASPSAEQELYEGESDLSVKGRGRPQNMSGFGRDWSGDAHYLWSGTIGESMSASFFVEKQARYQLAIRLTKAPDYGTFQIRINGKQRLAGYDLYASKVETTEEISLGEFDFSPGDQSLTLTLTGAHPKAKKRNDERYLLGLDYLRVRNLTPPPASSPGPEQTESREPDTQALPEPNVPNLAFSQSRALLKEYCIRCHGREKIKGDTDFGALAKEFDFLQNLELTSKIADALQFHEMPPDDEPPLPARSHRQLTQYFRRLVDQGLATANVLAPITMRRLNRYEYNNAVRDLLRLKGDIYPLPEKVIRESKPYYNPASGHFPRTVTAGNRTLGKNIIEKPILTGVVPFAMDLQAEHGFNNRGDELSISPILLESCLKLAHSILHAPEFNDYCGRFEALFMAPTGTDSEALLQLAADRLKPLMEQAFRSPVDSATLERFVHFFEQHFKQTHSFTQSMKAVVTGILASPRFLYIRETSPLESRTVPLSSYELATRLSFFLWSTLPDETLLAKARDQSLLEASVLQSEITRLLESPRSQALSLNFARQWLRLDQLITAVPDFERFEVYYSRIGCEQWKFGLQSMLEPLLLFESILVEDRSIMLLIDSNYSYRTDEMQSWYNDETPFNNKPNRDRFNTFTQAFRRRNLTDRREGGVITSAAILTMTSSPLRTSPINRGAWVASVIFNQPPPPPPDVVPEIEADDAAIESQGMTLRQRLVQHQTNESCASCHSKIDPMGFALENYDAVGRWRDRYRSGLPIDASGALFGEAEFSDIVGMKNTILEHPEWFVRAFSEHLLSYALGRELEVTDRPAIDRIVRQALEDKGQFSTIVKQVATSYPFRHKSQSTEP